MINIQEGKKYKTKDGRIVTIKMINCTTHEGYPILGILPNHPGSDYLNPNVLWTREGRWFKFHSNAPEDLVEEVIEIQSCAASCINTAMTGGDYA